MGRRYREMEIRTATPEALVVKMYEGAMRFARRARESHVAGDVKSRGEALSRALAIVSELEHVLDFEQGGDIARNLQSLYFFVNERFLHANLKGDAAAIDDGIAVLESLHGAWVEIARGGGGAAG